VGGLCKGVDCALVAALPRLAAVLRPAVASENIPLARKTGLELGVATGLLSERFDNEGWMLGWF
jgi:hypothetical protein